MSSTPIPEHREILEAIRKVLSEHEGSTLRGRINPEQSLAECDIDSIDLALVFAYFEQEFDLCFENDDIALDRYGSLVDVAVIVRDRLSAQLSR